MASITNVKLADCIFHAAAQLPDEKLLCELQCAEKCALIATRTRREAALLRARCLRLELERRRLAEAHTIANAPQVATV